MDIVLAVVLFLLTAVIGYLGVHVTLHPEVVDTPTKKTKYKWYFGVLVAIAAVLIGLQGYLSRSAQDHLQNQLNAIEKNTKTPPQVTVNVPSSTPPQVVVNQPSEPTRFPELTPHIEMVMSAPAGKDNKDAMIGITGSIVNVGSAGSVYDFGLDLRIKGKVFRGSFPVSPRSEQRFFLGKSVGGNDIYLSGKDYLTYTAGQNQITTNSKATGWLIAVVKGVTQKEIEQNNATVILTCTDSRGRKSSGERSFTGKEFAPMFGLGEIQQKPQ